MNSGSTDLGSHVFDSILVPHKFTTEGDLNWTIQCGLAEVVISIEENVGGDDYLVFYFTEQYARIIFRYNRRSMTMDASQSNGMSFSVYQEKELSTIFLFNQPKDKTKFQVSDQDWFIIANWPAPTESTPIEVKVSVEPTVTFTSSDI